MKFDITIYANVAFGMELEADSEAEAAKKAEQQFDREFGGDLVVSGKPIIDIDEVD